MCDKNLIELQNIIFAEVNDEFNWVTNSSNPITTESGELKLQASDASSFFSRGLGVLNAANNRIRLRAQLKITKPQASLDQTVKVWFGVYAGNTLIGRYSVYFDNLEAGQTILYNFDRIYGYEEIGGNVSVRITIQEGPTNELSLTYLKAENYNYCQDDVRTYFAIEEWLSNAIQSQSSAVQLLEWKVGGVETLTPAFFNENPVPNSVPANDWFLAKADLDGSNRVSDNSTPNTFNPFAAEWGLVFEQVNSFHGGKPLSVASGGDYGTGIMTVGFGKPVILNGNLEERKGVFFIDLDYSQNLKVVFNVVINNTSANVFDSPATYRKYSIEWDAETCTKKFYYQDQLAANPATKIDIIKEGFLFGLTPGIADANVVGCDEAFSYNGNSGTYEFQINFGTEVGLCGIDYDAFGVPDKFELEWDGQIFSSGYVGSNQFDQQLLNLGISASEIKTGNPSTGSGSILFNKTTAQPTNAIIRVTAPFEGTAWNMAGVCPNGSIQQPPTASLTTAKNSYELQEEVTFNLSASDVDGTIESWEVDFGDGTTESGIGAPPATLTKEYQIMGSMTAVLTVTDNNGLTDTDSKNLSILSNANYTLTGTRTANCTDGMNGTITVNSGTIVVRNETFYYSGSGNGTNISFIHGTVLSPGGSLTLGVGTWEFSSGQVECINGSGVTTLQIL